MVSLNGRVALVTGAGGGIGAAIAANLAARGARVIVHDLGVPLDGMGEGDPGAATGVAERINAEGGTAVAEFGDVTDYAQIGAVVNRAVERFGSLDVVVPSAGVLRDRMIFNMTEAEWDAVIAVHLRGLFNVVSHASTHWRAQPATRGGRRLIAVSSRSGVFGAATQPNYSAAKAAILGFVFSTAKALAKYDVASIALVPTAATRMTATVPGERSRVGADDDEYSPDNVGRVAAYLASERSGWLNGQIVGSNGYEVSLYTRPQVGVSLTGDRPWEPDRLAEAMEGGFGELAAAQSALGVPAKSHG